MTERSLITALGEAAGELRVIIPPLEAAVAEQRSEGGMGVRVAPRSRPPWDTQAAYAVLDIFYGVRFLEADLRQAVAGVRRMRGPGGTGAALDSVVSLAAGAAETDQRDALRRVTGWVRQGLLALGDEDEMRKQDQIVKLVTPCPWCRYRTLRGYPLRQRIFCVTPSCEDSDGRRPVARMEYGEFSHQWIAVWQDGTLASA